MKSIYFDNAATTKVDSKVIEAMQPYFDEKFGNASSVHLKGQEAKNVMEKRRKVIAKSIGANSREIIFTSGGTESNNFALKGLFFHNKSANTGKDQIITTKIEHDCVLNTCKWLETQGAKVIYLDVDKDGFVDPKDIEDVITDKTIVVSIIHGNNEIGTIQDLEEIGKVCKEKGVLFHTDACQSFTKVPINVKKQNLDLVTLNSHKIHGPKGVGALYIRDGFKKSKIFGATESKTVPSHGDVRKDSVGIEITPLFHGGGHERKLRSGTENIPGIVGFAKSVDVASPKNVQKMNELRDKLIKGILKIPNTKLNGPAKNRLCNNINVSFNNIEGEAVGGYLENLGIYTSTGSACASHSLETSHVLKALGLSPVQSNSSLRISISKYTTKEEVDYFLEKLPKIVNKLRRISPLVS